MSACHGKLADNQEVDLDLTLLVALTAFSFVGKRTRKEL